MTVLPARLVGHNEASEQRLIVVDDHGEDVRVQWRIGRRCRWKCDACGRMLQADCLHTFSAGLLLAECLLGLTRAREYQTTRTTHTTTEEFR